MFLFKENLLEIKELIDFTSDMVPCCSKDHPEPILSAKGYKNKILLVFKSKIELFTLTPSTLFSPDSLSTIKTITFPHPNSEKPLQNIDFLNNGKNLLILYKNIYLLNDRLQVLNIHKIDFLIHFLLIPNKQGKTYLFCSENKIFIQKINLGQSIVIPTKEKIDHICASFFQNKPEIVYSLESGEVMISKRTTNIRAFGQFCVKQEFLLYFDLYCKGALKVYNLITNNEIYSYRIPNFELAFHNKLEKRFKNFINFVPDNNFPYIFFFSEYKTLFLMGHQVHIHCFLIEKTFVVNLPFEEIYFADFFDPLLVVTGKTGKNFGVVVMDYYREMNLEAYDQALLLAKEETKESDEEKEESKNLDKKGKINVKVHQHSNKPVKK